MAKKVHLKKPKTRRTTKKKDPVEEINLCSQDFIIELISIFEDSFEYSKFKTEAARGKKHPTEFFKNLDLSDKNIASELFFNPEFRQADREYKSFVKSKENLFNSLFLWMWVTFERNMIKLITSSYQNDPDFKKRYQIKFSDEDYKIASAYKERKGSFKGLRTNEYNVGSVKKKESIELKHIPEVLGQEKLKTYGYLFDDGKWKDSVTGKEQINFYNEIRERRNLFIHRGLLADKEYINRTSKTYKIFKNPKDVEKFYKGGFFRIKGKSKKTPKVIIEGKTDLNCSSSYFFHCFLTLVRIYAHYYSFSLSSINKNKEERISLSTIMHPLMISGHELAKLEVGKKDSLTSLKLPLYIARAISLDFLESHTDNNFSEVHEIDLINNCLIHKDLNKIKGIKKSSFPLKDLKSHKELTQRNSLEDSYRMGLAFINDDLEKGFELLESISLNETEFHEWYIFKSLYNKPRFKQIYKKKFGEAFRPLDKR